MKNKNSETIYIYILNKKVNNPKEIYERARAKYRGVSGPLVSSLDYYLWSAGKKNTEERFVTASLILESVFNLVFFASFPIPGALVKDSLGKPKFERCDVKISIAHSEDLAIVAYTKGRDIGVDIEGEIPSERAEKLSKRFPAIASLGFEKDGKNDDDDTKIYLFEMSENGRFEPFSPTPADDSFTAKWTAAEALMKCDGRGFSALGEIQTLMKKMKVFTFSLTKENKKIYASIAEE
jgi:phosphopantetheinyl transferase